MALGSPGRPLSDQALVEKFADCTGLAAYPLTPASSAAVAEVILEGEPEVRLSSILDLLAAPQVGPA
jgi:hypothetical protein